MAKTQNVLFDVQGPRGRRVSAALNVVGVLLAAALAWVVLGELAEQGQLDAAKWTPLISARTWENFLLPGLWDTLRAALLAVVLSIAFGLVFGLGRLSQLAPVRFVCTVVVEFFRAVPVLVMMIFFYLGIGRAGLVEPSNVPFWAVVLGLMFYNGAVIAELIRSGVHQLPKGQREAALVIGLTPSRSLRMIELPQALTAMLPSMVSQFVVILKDTALGYIITYPELLASGRRLGAGDGNILQTLFVVALVFVLINYLLTVLAAWLSRFLSFRTGGATKAAEGPLAAEESTV